MKAEKATRSDNTRKSLAQQLPLKAPLSVYLQASNACNFKCEYCSQTLDDSALKSMNIQRSFMHYEIFETAIEQLQKFNGEIKVINITGFGEPLLNPRIGDMIRLAKEKKVAQRIELVTNGSMLTHEMSDKLTEAGLDLIRISIQGLTEKSYKRISGVEINMNMYLENLAYLYQNKKNTKIYIKMLGETLEENQTEEDFYNMFGNYCDNIAIEHLVPVMPGVDYSKVTDTNINIGMVGCKNDDIFSCPRPFYMMTVNTDGLVRPCCNYDPPMIIGDINKESLFDIWNGKKMIEFRINQLKNGIKSNSVCKQCQTPIFGLHEEDNIDMYKEELMTKY